MIKMQHFKCLFSLQSAITDTILLLLQNFVNLSKSHPIDSSTSLETLLLCSPSMTSTTPSVLPTIFTTTEDQMTGTSSGVSLIGTAIGVTLLGLILIMVIVLILIVVIFVLLKQQHRRTKTIEVANALYEKVPDIAISPTVHVEVNERGRIRRRTMDTQADFEIQRARAVSS